MKRLFTFFVVMSFCVSSFAQENMALQTQCQNFAFTFFNRLSLKEKTNVCFSPLSAQYALSMVLNGADGETLRQMKGVLGFEIFDVETVNQYLRQVMIALTTRPDFEYNPSQWETEEEQRAQYETQYPICELANGVWMKNGFPFYDTFLNTLQEMYQAELGNVDFTTQEGIDVINNWAKDKTHGLIPQLFAEPLDFDVVMLLANALYFKGAWSVDFDENETTRQVFHNANGTDIDVDMMHKLSYQWVAHNGKFTVVKLPYGNGDFSMTLFLPEDDFSFPQLTFDDWMMGRLLLQPKNIYLSLPCFTTEGSYDLVDRLKESGMVDAFDQTMADFSKLSPKDVFVSKVNQLSKIVVNEKGTEAAAVTYVAMAGNSMPQEPEEYVTFDRPFYYTIEHNGTGMVLFVGRVNQFDNNTAHGSVNGINTPVRQSNASQLYDLTGRRLNGIPHKGVYIQNGQKYVGR